MSRFLYAALALVGASLSTGCARSSTPQSAPAPSLTRAQDISTPVAARPKATTSKTKPRKTVAPNSIAKGVSVLCYHRLGSGPDIYTIIRPAQFEAQLKYLKQNKFQVVPLQKLVADLKAGAPIKPKTVAITFDDGYIDCYTVAFPILKRFKFPATMFVYPEYIGNGRDAMTWEHLKKMRASGLIDIQSHSYSHPDLDKMKNGLGAAAYAQKLKQETQGSKKAIEAKVGFPVTQIAYPYGSRNAQAIQAVRAAKFESAFTVERKPIRYFSAQNQVVWNIPRQMIGRKDSLSFFGKKALNLIRDPKPNS